MIAMLILLVIFAGLVYFQVFTQGLFSCFIMMVWTIVAAVVALNYQEYLAMLMINNGYAYFPRAVALMIPFMVVLFGLRLLSDSLITGNMKFHDIIDRVGSIVFSLVSSLIITGIISITLQSLPLGTKILGYERIGDMTDITKQSTFWPAGDAFVVKSMSMISANCFAGKMEFGQYHPDFLQNLHMNKIVPPGFVGSYQFAPSGTISVKEIKIRNSDIQLVKITAANGTSPEQKNNVGKLEKGTGDMISVVVKINSMPTGNVAVTCKDADGNFRFALAQFRLVGFAQGQEVIECYPATIMAGSSGEPLTLAEGKGYSVMPEQIELVFKWPTSVKSTPPVFLEFKNTCRAEVPAINPAEDNNDPLEEVEN